MELSDIPECRRCGDPPEEWEGPGGNLYSPPSPGADWLVAKDHLCPGCYKEVMRFVDRGA